MAKKILILGLVIALISVSSIPALADEKPEEFSNEVLLLGCAYGWQTNGSSSSTFMSLDNDIVESDSLLGITDSLLLEVSSNAISVSGGYYLDTTDSSYTGAMLCLPIVTDPSFLYDFTFTVNGNFTTTSSLLFNTHVYRSKSNYASDIVSAYSLSRNYAPYVPDQPFISSNFYDEGDFSKQINFTSSSGSSFEMIYSDISFTGEDGYKCFSFYMPGVYSFNANGRFSYSITQITCTYTEPEPTIDEETLASLKALQESVDALGGDVKLILENQEGIQTSIEELSGKVDNIGEDVAENIANKEKEEGNAAQSDALEQGDQFANDLNNEDIGSKLDITGKLSDFWGMLSSTNVATSLTFPGAVDPFTKLQLWEEAEIDFSTWLDNPLIKYLLQLVRVLTSLGMLWYVLKLYYDMVNAVLNKNSERSLMQVVLHYNPFK